MNKKLIIGILVIIILLHAKAFSQTQEALTITTYYPSPRGVYKELTTENLTVSDRTDTYRLHVGDSRTYLDGLDGAGLHWIMVGGSTEGTNNILGFSPGSNQVNVAGNLRVYNVLTVGDGADLQSIAVNGVGIFKENVYVQNSKDLVVDSGIAYANDFIKNSSKEYKDDIQPLAAADYRDILNKLEQTKIYRFRYKGKEQNTKLNIGLLAEESPTEIVSENGKGIGLGDAMGFLMAAVKAQQEEINSLKEEIKKLRNK